MISDGLSLRWNNYVVFELADGRQFKFKNTVTDSFRKAVASLLADQSTGVPSTIKLGTGAMTGYALSNWVSSQTVLGPSYSEVAQGFQVSAAGPVNSALLYLTRVGTSAGTLSVEIQTNNAGEPSGTPVTNGVSDSVQIDSLETNADNGGWVRFEFPEPLPELSASTQYHLVLKTSGYTYALGTSEVRWCHDASSPTYANGELYGNWSGWVALGYDGIFRIVRQTDGLMTDLVEILASADLVSKSKYNAVTARLLSTFAAADAADYICEVGLYDDLGNLLAISNVAFDKSALNSGVSVYWLIEVLGE